MWTANWWIGACMPLGEGDVTTVEIRIEDTWQRREPKVKWGHGAQFAVALDRLAVILGLPEGARIVSITGGLIQQMIQRTVTVMVEHSDLPEVVEGDVVPGISPTFEWCDMEGKEILTDWGAW